MLCLSLDAVDIFTKSSINTIIKLRSSKNSKARCTVFHINWELVVSRNNWKLAIETPVCIPPQDNSCFENV